MPDNFPPTWFNLDNYNDAENLDALGWHVNLHQRAVCKRLLDRNTSDSLERFADYFLPIQQRGLIAVEESHFPSEVKMGEGNYRHYTPTVSPLTYHDAIETYETIPDQYLYDVSDLPDQEIADFQDSSIDINECELGVWSGEARLKISLHGTLEQIVSDFESFIQTYKDKLGQDVTEKNITQSEFSRWGKYKILPFIDLQLWSQKNRKKVPDYIYGNILFPNDLDADITERIRKTVRRQAAIMLTSSFLYRLQHQAGRPLI